MRTALHADLAVAQHLARRRMRSLGLLMENMLGCRSSPCAVSLGDMTSRMASQMLSGQILQQAAGTLRGAVPVLLRNACEEV